MLVLLNGPCELRDIYVCFECLDLGIEMVGCLRKHERDGCKRRMDGVSGVERMVEVRSGSRSRFPQNGEMLFMSMMVGRGMMVVVVMGEDRNGRR